MQDDVASAAPSAHVLPVIIILLCNYLLPPYCAIIIMLYCNAVCYNAVCYNAVCYNAITVCYNALYA